MRECSLVGEVFVYKGSEGRSRGYFGSVSVCKSNICRKLIRKQTKLLLMNVHRPKYGELRQTIVILEKERDLGKEREVK